MVSLKSLLTTVYLSIILPLAVVSSTYLFLYPLWHQCSFPDVAPSGPISAAQPKLAPFRLLTLADPQIEGDTRLIRIKLRMPAGSWRDIPDALKAKDWTRLRKVTGETLDRAVLLGMYAQKWVDIWGNDLYLAHVFRTMYWWTKPSHVTVLGDLLSSHWIGDEEFYRRARRFYNVIFRGMEKVEVDENGVVKMEGVDWSKKVMNVVGNHDVGYAGDMTKERIARFEDAFGKPDYIWEWNPPAPPGNFTYPPPPPGSGEDAETGSTPPVLRIIVLNSLTLDKPLWDSSLADASFDLINHSLKTKPLSPHQGTLLLTHIPFYKPAGVCTDGPSFDYYASNFGSGVKSQNHLSDANTQLLLGIFGMPSGTTDMSLRRKAKGLVMTGHDHPGCDVWHYWAEQNPGEPQTTGDWSVLEFANKPHMDEGLRKAAARGALGDGGEDYTFEGVREVTVRSMMGEFGGNAGLLSAWFDWDSMEWRFEYGACELGVQHLWWGTYITLFIAVVGGVVLGGWHLAGAALSGKREVPVEKKTQ